jgi:hypothetical protein
MELLPPHGVFQPEPLRSRSIEQSRREIEHIFHYDARGLTTTNSANSESSNGPPKVPETSPKERLLCEISRATQWTYKICNSPKLFWSKGVFCQFGNFDTKSILKISPSSLTNEMHVIPSNTSQEHGKWQCWVHISGYFWMKAPKSTTLNNF